MVGCCLPSKLKKEINRTKKKSPPTCPKKKNKLRYFLFKRLNLQVIKEPNLKKREHKFVKCILSQFCS